MFKDNVLKDKVILVTGGGTGLGRSMVERFLELGAKVAISSRRKELLSEVALELSAKYAGEVYAVGVDVRDAAAVTAMIQEVWTHFGRIDGLVNNAAGKKSLQLWVDSINKYKISPLSMAETRTDDSRKIMQAGNAVFGLNWAYAWAHFQGSSPDATKVKGLIGVTRLPTFAQGGVASSTCQGGWHWGLSKFSKNKAAGFELMKFMSELEAQKDLSIKAGFLPVRKSVYNNSAVLRANPHYVDLYPIVLKARPRPISAVYPKVSEIIRTNLNAVVAGAKTVDKGLEDMQNALEPLFK